MTLRRNSLAETDRILHNRKRILHSGRRNSKTTSAAPAASWPCFRYLSQQGDFYLTVRLKRDPQPRFDEIISDCIRAQVEQTEPAQHIIYPGVAGHYRRRPHQRPTPEPQRLIITTLSQAMPSFLGDTAPQVAECHRQSFKLGKLTRSWTSLNGIANPPRAPAVTYQ